MQVHTEKKQATFKATQKAKLANIFSLSRCKLGESLLTWLFVVLTLRTAFSHGRSCSFFW